MRLLNAKTLQLEEFEADEIAPPYAILSHTWDRGEVLFADIDANGVEGKPGYWKIKAACFQAYQDDLSHIWIDTCCIDKSSSAELSEAINSMYLWYQEAAKCYACLSDVHAPPQDTYDLDSEFAKSRWFTRGWTLQELIAPSNVIFYSRSWTKLGEKHGLCKFLSTVTGVDEEILAGSQFLESVSVAKRMSWASLRETTRREDLAYCLMGLFSVHMPMLYGEGERAFIRLQEEILKTSDDETLFAWTIPVESEDEEHGLLATSPAFFANSGSYVPYPDPRGSVPYAMTNQGIRMNVNITHIDYSETIHVAALNCPHPGENRGSLGIFLKRIAAGGHYTRVKLDELPCFYFLGAEEQEIRVRQTRLHHKPQDSYETQGINIRKLPLVEHGYRIVSIVQNEDCQIKSAAQTPEEKEAEERREMPQAILPKTRGELVFSILFDSYEPERILVSIGSRSHTDIGFSAIGVPRSASTVGEAWVGSCMSFLPPSSTVKLTHHRVSIKVESKPSKRQKLFWVDIEIEAVQGQRPHFSYAVMRVTEDKEPEDQEEDGK